MENEDKSTFSLDDDEIVEEETIETDVEDEDYDDEEYDDEEYDEEEPEEDYDDGYNDDYYDDRLNKVLDEIAELKRGMQNQPAPVQPMPPQYVYQPSAPPAGSEVVMYNEISRLRDELAKNQSSLEMQKELTRIKDDMARDQKFAESQYNAEIKRLQDKIDDLLKNASSPQSEQLPPPQGAQARLEGGHSIDFEKLLSINEAILRATRDSDARLQGEIAQLKHKVESIPSADDINRAVAKRPAGGDGVSSEALNRLAADIASLRSAVQGMGAAPAASSSSSAPVVVQNKSGDISASELLRQLYDIKSAIGSSSAAAVKRAQAIGELINEFKKVNFDVHSHNVSYKDKLASVFNYSEKLADSSEPDVVDLIEATNGLIEELSSANVTRQVFSDLAAYCAEIGDMSITPAMRDSASRYFDIAEKVALVDISEVSDYLPDLIAEKNVIQNNAREEENNKLFNELSEALFAEDRDDEAVHEKLNALVSLKASELIDLPLIPEPRAYKPSRSVSDDSIFTKLAEIKNAIDDAAGALAAQKAEEEQAEEEAEEAPAEEQPELATAEAVEEAVTAINTAMDELRNNYVDIASQLVDISSKIVEPPEEQPEVVMTAEDKEKALADLEYIRTKLDDHELFINQIGDLRNDILNIPAAIDLTEQFANVITELSSQSDKLYEDISAAILDTETNIINRINEIPSVADLIDAAKADVMVDTQALRDDTLAIRDAIAALNDSVTTVSETIVTLPIGDAVEQLRSDVLNLTDQVTLNADAAIEDRQKILDDISFLREQAELALAEREEEPADSDEKSPEELEREKLYGYLDDITARLETLTQVAEDTASVKDGVLTLTDIVTPISDTVLTVSDGVTALTDNVTAIGDNVSLINDSVTLLSDNVTAINDGVTLLSDNVTATRDAATAALDALTPITERINEIIERMDKEAEAAALKAEEEAALEEEQTELADEEPQPDPVAEDLEQVKESLNTILDTLTLLPQSEDLVTARDNTYSILDTLTLMPQSDDVVTTRDNVAAMLDAVTALTEDITALRESLPEAMGEDIALVRDNTATILDSLATLAQTQEDVAYIREKLDEEPAADDTVTDTLTSIMTDLGAVLDKLEAFEQTSVSNKQEIIDTVGGIREEIHISELDETISATGIDDETRETLVTEIAEIRERLNNIDTVTQNISDATTLALDNITAQLTELQAAVESGETAEEEKPAGDVQAVLDEVNEKLAAIVDGMGDSTSFEALAADIAEIKERLDGGVAVKSDENGAPVLSDENLQAIIDELSVIKEKIDTESDYDTVEEILSLRDDVKAARIVDANEVSSELEAIKNELAAISSGNILDEVRALREEIAAVAGGQAEGAPAATDDELNLVLNEIVSLRDEVFAFKDEVLSATAAAESTEEEPAEAAPSEELNNILDELTDLRETQNTLTESIEELKDVISRRTSIASDDATAEAAPASNELNIVLDEIINIKNDIDGISDKIPVDSIDALTKQVDELRTIVDGLVQANAPEEAGEEVSLADIKDKLETIELGAATVDMTEIAEQLDNINNAINDLRLAGAAEALGSEEPAASGSLTAVIEDLRADMEDVKAAVGAIGGGDVSGEIAELRAEIENLRAENEALRQAQNDAVASELAELREAVHDMALGMTPAASEGGDTSYAALIEEIKGLKDQIAAVQAPSATLDEETIQSLRDVLASQADTAMPIAEELGDIRDEIAQLRSLTTVTADAGSAAAIAALRDDIADLKAALSASDSMLGLAEDVTSIRADVQTLKEEPDLGVMNEILALRDEFQALREEIEDVKRVAGKTDKESDDAILTEVQSLRDQLFAISMANVNDASSGETNYESYNNIILDEIAGLREQVESAGSTEDLKSVSEELAKLKSTIDKRESQYDALAGKVNKLTGDATNKMVLDEIAALHTEIDGQRDSNNTILGLMAEIVRLMELQNSRIAAAPVRNSDVSADSASTSDSDLADSLSDLKDQLNEIAGIVDSGAKKPAAKKSMAKKSAPRKRNAKKAAAETPSVTEPVALDVKIDEEAADLEADGMAVGDASPKTMDVAGRLAQKVANRLVIEQLVEQLGYSGMTDEQVDEIINELPQELTTTALDAQSERVRKLANQLVMNKLQERLGNKNEDED